MATKKDDDTGRQDGTGAGGNDDAGTDDGDGDDGDDGDEEAGWARMQEMIDTSVGKAFESWSKQQKTTSSNSRRKPEKKAAPSRKQGFLSGQFFSNLNPTDE